MPGEGQEQAIVQTETSRLEAKSTRAVQPGNPPANGSHGQLTAAFRWLAQSIAEARFVVPPYLLGPTERRQHVRRTLREDHQYRLHHRPEGALKKFDKLTLSPFTFFRGTALLFYRDLAGWDADRPVVFLNGDVHPENFGVMPSEDGTPFFGPNDFDEAYHGPFSWDLRRGGVAFNLAAQEKGFKKGRRAKIVDSFIDGYFTRLGAILSDPRDRDHQFRIDNSPPLIRDLLLAARRDRKQWLTKLVDTERNKFRPSDEIVPLSSKVPQFQRIVSELKKPTGADERHYTVKDVALRKGGGTASLGLDKYYVLIEGPSDGEHDDVILEMKHTRASALRDLVPHVSTTLEDGADRVVLAQQVHLAGGDPYYGHTTIDGESFLVRERSPYKKSLKMVDLSYKQLKNYAHICGEALAVVHARSDDLDAEPKGEPIEEQILHSVSTRVFRNDMVHFAEDGAKRVRDDYKAFCEDHELGAFKPGRFQV